MMANHHDVDGTFADTSTANFPANHVRDPMHSSRNKNLGVTLVSRLLEGSENYITWKKSMLRALGFKMKVGFLYGRFEKPQDPYDLARWEMCNNAVLS